MAGHLHRRVGIRGVSPIKGNAEAGFLLPLASLASLVMLLGCLSMQSMTLQNAQRLAALSRLRQAEDSSMSAAQQLVAALQGQHRCLLPLALEQWTTAACISAEQLQALARGEVNSTPYELVGWRPQANATLATEPAAEAGAELLLELRPLDGQQALRSAFAVALQGNPAAVKDLRPLGLRGIAP